MSTAFDAHAEDYHAALDQGLGVSGETAEFFARGRIAWLADRLRGRGIGQPAVLDLGCGTGTATPYFFELLGARSVLGVDESARSLEVARRSHGSSHARFEVTSGHEPTGAFDLVYCNGVMHHVAVDRRAALARYVASCLRPGGVFALWENNPWSPAARYVMSRIPFDRGVVMVWPRDARRLMRKAGLSAAWPDYCFIFPRVLGGLRFLERYASRLPLGAQYLVLGRKDGARECMDRQ
jgi:SAM-dependent methyltransferase